MNAVVQSDEIININGMRNIEKLKKILLEIINKDFVHISMMAKEPCRQLQIIGIYNFIVVVANCTFILL